MRVLSVAPGRAARDFAIRRQFISDGAQFLANRRRKKNFPQPAGQDHTFVPEPGGRVRAHQSRSTCERWGQPGSSWSRGTGGGADKDCVSFGDERHPRKTYAVGSRLRTSTLASPGEKARDHTSPKDLEGPPPSSAIGL